MPLRGCTIEEAAGSRRQLAVCSQQRTLHLIAADETEARAWFGVLSRAAAEVTDQLTLASARLTSSKGPLLMDDLASIIEMWLPSPSSIQATNRPVESASPAADEAAAPSGAPAAAVASGALYDQPHNKPLDQQAQQALEPQASPELPNLHQGLSAVQEDSLCAFLLTVHSFGPVGETGALLCQRYDTQQTEPRVPEHQWVRAVLQPLRRRTAYVLLRWAQMHPDDFSCASGRPLRALWQRAARDGYLAELGLHTSSASLVGEPTCAITGLDRASTEPSAPQKASSLDGFKSLATFSGKESSKEREARRDWASTETILPADNGVWQPFVDGKWLRRGAQGVAQTDLSELSLTELHQALRCAAVPLGPSLPPGPRDVVRMSGSGVRMSASVGRRISHNRQPSGGSDLQAVHRKLQAQLKLALAAPLQLDTVGLSHWMAVEPVQLARHFTLCDERLYHGVNHGHLLSYVWSAKDGGARAAWEQKQPLMELTQRFNETANVISTAVVGTPQLQDRAALIGHFVATAVELRKLHNFNGVMAILAGLSCAAVHRLRCCKQRTSKQTKAEWEALSSLMSHHSAHKEYRAALAQQRRLPPFIPYLGVHLTDLTFIGEGNKDRVSGNINLGKRQQVHAAISSCLAGRTERFSFTSLPGLERMLEAAPRWTEEELYKASLLREPRGVSLAELERLEE